MRTRPLRVDSIELRPVVHAVEVNPYLDETIDTTAARDQDGFDVCQCLACLFREARIDEPFTSRRDRQLSGDEHEAVRDGTVRIMSPGHCAIARIDRLHSPVFVRHRSPSMEARPRLDVAARKNGLIFGELRPR